MQSLSYFHPTIQPSTIKYQLLWEIFSYVKNTNGAPRSFRIAKSIHAISVSNLKRLLVIHNLKTGQDIVHEFCDTDFAFELVEGSPEPDTNGDLDVESELFYRID